MCSLATFPTPPPEGFVTVCEQNAEMVACLKGDLPQNQLVLNSHYPEVDISQDHHRPALARDSEARAAFLEHEDTPRKRILRAWYEHGLTGVLEELASSSGSEPGQGREWLSYIASSVLATVRCADSLHGSLFPHLAMSGEELIKEFSQNPDWQEGYIRCFAWHPHTTKFALALRDDSIRVYMARRGDIVPTLRHKLQKGVSTLAWKPCSASTLAVACQTCILIWHVDPMSLATRPSSSSVQVLSQPGHCPVTSLAWCPLRGLLASASPTDTSVRVWDVAMETCVALRRVGGGGTSLLAWSPDGTKLLTACPSSIFRVWETCSWTCEKWTKLSGRVQAACWSPDGLSLLFATIEEPIIYCLTFQKPQPNVKGPVIGGSKVAVSSADVSQVDLQTDDAKTIVGGLVQTMCWDPTGERLAVTFKGANRELIALFQTRLQPNLELIPCGFVRGYPGDTPSIVSFQSKFENGALLTVVWTSGKVTYVPLYFVARSCVNLNSLYQQQNLNGQLHRPTTLYSAEHQ